jgi:hypothetical protein
MSAGFAVPSYAIIFNGDDIWIRYTSAEIAEGGRRNHISWYRVSVTANNKFRDIHLHHYITRIYHLSEWGFQWEFRVRSFSRRYRAAMFKCTLGIDVPG